MKDHIFLTQLVFDCRMPVVAIRPDTRSWLYLKGMLCGRIKSSFKAETTHVHEFIQSALSHHYNMLGNFFAKIPQNKNFIDDRCPE